MNPIPNHLWRTPVAAFGDPEFAYRVICSDGSVWVASFDEQGMIVQWVADEPIPGSLADPEAEEPWL